MSSLKRGIILEDEDDRNRLHRTRCKCSNFKTIFDTDTTWIIKFYLQDSYNTWSKLSNGQRITWMQNIWRFFWSATEHDNIKNITSWPMPKIRLLYFDIILAFNQIQEQHLSHFIQVLEIPKEKLKCAFLTTFPLLMVYCV